MKVDEIALASADERRILFSDVCRQLSQKVPESMVEKVGNRTVGILGAM